jgi:hypothetical protein
MKGQMDQYLHHLRFKMPTSATFFDRIDLWLNQPVVDEKIALHARITSSNLRPNMNSPAQ